MHPAIFLDRDGTIIEDRGYIKDPLDMVFYPESFRALKLLQEYFLLFIITNQPGVSKGLITEKDVRVVNDYLIESLKARGIVIYDIFYCPHMTEDNCACKKPSPFFIHKAARMYNLNLAESYIIGDHPSDVLCGINAGITPYYLLTGHGVKHRNELPDGITVFDNILEATENIIKLKVKI